jgi:glycosyltransferase involved in cell wall biosynthesis
VALEGPVSEPSGVCAAVLFKDEADIIEYTVRHLLDQVDHVMAVDNGSTDDSRAILEAVGGEIKGDRATLDIWDDPEPGYYQADKMTAFAARAVAEGYRWFVPCDADEYWYSPFGRLADAIAAAEETEPQAMFFRAELKNHIVTGFDSKVEPDPFRRLRWRLEEMNALPKIACRLVPGLRISMGNHDAWGPGIVRASGLHTIPGQLYIHHYPWRSEEQFLRKIRNGSRAYAATNLPPEFGDHWRSFGLPDDPGFEERVRGWFREWGYRGDPTNGYGEPLVEDPAV